MPFSTPLQRRDSWPPTIIHLSRNNNTNSTSTTPSENDNPPTSKDIDEDPFSFFLTRPEDLDDYYSDEEFSAGIEDATTKPVPVREVSPSSLQRGQDGMPHMDEEEDQDDEEDEEDGDGDDEGGAGLGVAIPLSLREFAKRYSSPRPKGRGVSDGGRRAEEEAMVRGLGIAIPISTAARGRAKVRVIPRGRGLTRSRSWSGGGRKSPISWREPSPDIWRIDEGEEEEDVEMGGLSVSAPPSTQIGGGGMGMRGGMGGLRKRAVGEEGKGKKRVHWAL